MEVKQKLGLVKMLSGLDLFNGVLEKAYGGQAGFHCYSKTVAGFLSSSIIPPALHCSLLLFE